MRSTEAPTGPDVSTSADRDLTFRRLMGASTVSMLGSHMTTIAYPMLVLKLTGSPLTAGWVAFAAMAPSFLAYVPAGALIDRWDPRRTMLWSEVGRGAAISAVVITILLRKSNVPLLIVAAVVEGILEVFSTLAERSCIGTVVERQKLPLALAQTEGRTHAVLVAGRPLGGLLFGIYPAVPFVADVGTFFYSVLVLRKLRNNWQASPAAGPYGEQGVNRHLWSDIRLGFHWLRDNRFAQVAIIIFSVGTLAFQALIMIFLADAHAQRLSPLSVGIVLAASGLGGTLGSVAASPLLKRDGRDGYSWIKFQTVTWFLGFAILWATAGRPFLLMAVVMAVLGLSGALGNIELDVYLMRRVNQDMLARVTSISRLASFGACAVGPALGGILVAGLGAQRALFFIMIPMAVLTATIPFPRLLHDWPR
ncbi:MAG TPA: MFS transporter [Trebonia sp.]|nr:MFS transporter [Trebonia sp.]